MNQYLIAQRGFQLNEVSPGAGTRKAIRLTISQGGAIITMKNVTAASYVIPGTGAPAVSRHSVVFNIINTEVSNSMSHKLLNNNQSLPSFC